MIFEDVHILRIWRNLEGSLMIVPKTKKTPLKNEI